MYIKKGKELREGYKAEKKEFDDSLTDEEKKDLNKYNTKRRKYLKKCRDRKAVWE